MNETIRDRIKRRVRWTMAAGTFGCLASLLAAVSMHGGSLNHREAVAALTLMGFMLFGGGALWWASWTRCRKCAERIGPEIGMRVAFAIFRKPPNFCPYCGVSLDEPCP